MSDISDRSDYSVDVIGRGPRPVPRVPLPWIEASLPWAVQYVLAAGTDGPLYAVGYDDVAAVDPSGEVLWSRAVAEVRGPVRACAEGILWSAHGSVWGPSELHETASDGSAGIKIVLRGERGARITGFLVLPDGFLIAWEPTDGRNFAQLERADRYGMTLWTTMLPCTMGAVPGYEGRRVPEPVWKHMAPMGRSAHLMLSGDRVLAHYRDAERTGGAVVFCLDAVTGEFLWSTPSARQPVIAGPGEFLTQGYEEMHLRARDGSVGATIPGVGKAWVAGDGQITVLDVASQRVHRASPDGEVTRSIALYEYGEGATATLGADGALLLSDGHYLAALDPGLSLHPVGHTLGHLDGRLLLLDSGLVCTRSKGSLVLLPTELPVPAEGIWTGTQGNLQGNPVHLPAGY